MNYGTKESYDDRTILSQRKSYLLELSGGGVQGARGFSCVWPDSVSQSGSGAVGCRMQAASGDRLLRSDVDYLRIVPGMEEDRYWLSAPGDASSDPRHGWIPRLAISSETGKTGLQGLRHRQHAASQISCGTRRSVGDADSIDGRSDRRGEGTSWR